MRRILLACSATCISAVLFCGSADGQVGQHHGNSGHSGTSAPLQVFYSGFTRTPAATHAGGAHAHLPAGAAAVSQPGFTQGGFGAHHHHGFGGHQHQAYAGLATTSIFLNSGYPYWGGGSYFNSGLYTPAFAPYAVAIPYYFGPSMNVGVQMPAAAPQPRNLDPVDAADDPPAKPKPRVSTADQKTRAGKLLGFGDANFGKQQYFAAADRYKSAAQFAPDLAEPFFRQGYALVAVGQYDNAVKAFRRGLSIRSDWSGSPFRLDQLYGDAQLAKTDHIENLAKAIEANPLDANPLLALGLTLYFDGQRERASIFFTRVAQLGGNQDHLLDDFLKPRPTGAGPAQAPDDGKIVF